MNIGNIDKNMRIEAFSSDGMKWFDVKKLPELIYGLAWFQQETLYRRLPRKPAYPIPENVDYLADNTAGGQIRLTTDARRLAIKVRLQHSADLYHMPSTGQCGFDCYVETAEGLKYYSTTRHDPKQTEYEYEFYATDTAEQRNVVLHFPLYQGVIDAFIGVNEDASVLEPYTFANSGKVVCYGTSITQGGCASRPGMCYTNILSRRLNKEFVNLGFSGNGKGEPELARLINEIKDVDVVVLDYEANAGDGLLHTLEPFIGILRAEQPRLPILVVSKIRYANENFSEQRKNERLKLLCYQRELVRRLRDEGDDHIHFFDSSQLLGDDFEECTVDGAHPTDLGFIRMADKLGPAIADIC